jgi:hypothetical protein
MKFQNWKSNSGSVAQAMVVLLIVAGIAYYVAEQAIQNQKKALIEKISFDVNTTTFSVFGYLTDIYKCTATFQSTLTPNEITSVVRFDTINTQSVKQVVLSTQEADLKIKSNGGKEYGNTKLTIDSYTLLDSTPYAKLQIVFNNPNSMAKPQFTRFINIQTEWEGTPFASKLKKCQAVAGEDMIWTVGSGASIYYTGGASKTGKVGIDTGGETPLDSELDVKGSVAVSMPRDELDATMNARVQAKRYLYISDAKEKANVRKVDQPLARITQLQGVGFEWKNNNQKDFGFIAQDVEKVFPDVVFTIPTSGNLTIDYAKLIGVLTEAVKEQQQQISRLKHKIEKLKEAEKAKFR